MFFWLQILSEIHVINEVVDVAWQKIIKGISCSWERGFLESRDDGLERTSLMLMFL